VFVSYNINIYRDKMIRFFRKIRQRLINEKKAGNYFLYAFGEVVILIFGIVIAIQFNNWNEHRKDKDFEISILKAIKSDLKIDSTGVEGDIGIHKEQITSSNIILNHLNNDLPYHDSLDVYFDGTTIFTTNGANTASYETLKSLGVGLISNDKIRNQIIFYYDSRQTFSQGVGQGVKDLVKHAVKYVFDKRFEEVFNYSLNLGENLEPIGSIGSMKPINYESLKTDLEYKYYLKTMKNLNKIYLDVLYDEKSKIARLMINIEAELKILD